MGQCYHVVNDLESNFIWRIRRFDTSTKYRKIAPLVEPSALRLTLEARSSSSDSAKLRLLRETESRQQHSLDLHVNPTTNIGSCESGTHRDV